MADQFSSSSNETPIAIPFPELLLCLLEIWGKSLTEKTQAADVVLPKVSNRFRLEVFFWNDLYLPRWLHRTKQRGVWDGALGPTKMPTANK